MSIISFGAVRGWINKEDDIDATEDELECDSHVVYERVRDAENEKGTLCTGCREECSNDDSYCPF